MAKRTPGAMPHSLQVLNFFVKKEIASRFHQDNIFMCKPHFYLGLSAADLTGRASPEQEA
jgi:hypothetical protein